MDHKQNNSSQSPVLQQKNNSFFQSKGAGTFFGVSQQKSFFGNARQTKKTAAIHEQTDQGADLAQLKSVNPKGGKESSTDSTPSNGKPLMPFQFRKTGGERKGSNNEGSQSNKLPPLVQWKMEGAFGRDFSDVNIHQNSGRATKMGALAFTQGKDVHFAPGQYKPGTPEGDELIGHEYAHVEQQMNGRVKPTETALDGSPINADKDLESEADQKGAKAARFEPSADAVQKKSNTKAKGAVQMKSATQMKPKPMDEEPMVDDFEDKPSKDKGGKAKKGAATGEASAPPTPPSDGGDSSSGAGDPTPNKSAKGKSPKGDKKSSPTKGKSPAKGGSGAAPQKESAGAAPTKDGGESDAPVVAGGGGEIAAYLRQLSQAQFEKGKQKIKQLATNQKKAETAKKKKEQSKKAAVAPAKEGQSKANSKRVKKVHQKPKPTTNKAKAKSDFKKKLENSLPKKVKHVEDFKKSKKAKNIGKAAMDAVAVDKNKVTSTYGEIKNIPSPEANTPHTPLPGLEKAPDTPKMNLGQNMVGELKTEHTDFSKYKKDSDEALKKEQITQTHLDLVTDGDLYEAKKGREEIQTTADKAPNEVNKLREEKTKKLDQDLQQEEQQGRQTMQVERDKELNAAKDKQNKAKGDFEKERQKVTEHINKLYEGARTKVDQKLKNLEQQAFKDFDQGQAKATKEFEDSIDKDMKALKKKRYKGFRGKLRWVRDKILGISSVKEVKDLMEKARTAYVSKIDKLIETITKRNEQVINECREIIENVRKQIDEYVDGLPEKLQSVGEAAEDDIAKKLDDLDKKITEKELELQQKLAEKREEAIQAIDKKIAEMKKKMGGILSKVLNFLVEAALKFLKWALKSVGLNPDPLINTIRNIADAIIKIVKDPVGFLKNLIKAVGGGFKEFGKNIKANLMESVGGWLTTKLGVSGIEFPRKFDLKGVLKMVLSVLGISWTNIKGMFSEFLGGDFISKIEGGVGLIKGFIQDGPASLKDMGEDKVKEKLTEKVGADKMEGIYKVVDLVKTVIKEGPKAIFGWVKDNGSDLKDMAMEQVGGIKDMVIGGIKDFVKKKLIEEGIKKVISFLTPAGGIVSAIVSIYQSVKFFIENKDGLKQLFSSIIGALGNVVQGNVPAAIEGIKNSIMLAIPLLLDFVVKLLNLDGIFKAIKDVIGKVVGAVNKFLRKIVEWVSKIIKKVVDKVKAWFEKIKDKVTGKDKEEDEVPDYGDPEKNQKVSAALAKVNEEEAKHKEGEEISYDNAQKVVETVKASPEGQVFSKLNVIDGGDRWDYEWAASPTQIKQGPAKAAMQGGNGIPIKITFANKSPLKSVKIYDTNGNVVHEQKNSDKITLDADVPQGIYFVKVESDDNSLTQKILKEGDELVIELSVETKAAASTEAAASGNLAGAVGAKNKSGKEAANNPADLKKVLVNLLKCKVISQSDYNAELPKESSGEGETKALTEADLPKTVAAIKKFQVDIMGKKESSADGRVDAGGKTWRELKKEALVPRPSQEEMDQIEENREDFDMTVVDGQDELKDGLTGKVGNASGNAVTDLKAVQNRLKELGYLSSANFNKEQFDAIKKANPAAYKDIEEKDAAIDKKHIKQTIKAIEKAQSKFKVNTILSRHKSKLIELGMDSSATYTKGVVAPNDPTFIVLKYKGTATISFTDVNGNEDSQNMGNMVPSQYTADLENGWATSGSVDPQKDPITLFTDLGLTNTQAEALRYVAVNEGNFDAINTWDGVKLSYGFIQFTGRYTLSNMLATLKQMSPTTFDDLFKKYGIDVTYDFNNNKVSNAQVYVVDPATSSVLKEMKAYAYIQENPELTGIFIKAASHIDTKKAQIASVMRDKVKPAEGISFSTDLPVVEVLSADKSKTEKTLVGSKATAYKQTPEYTTMKAAGRLKESNFKNTWKLTSLTKSQGGLGAMYDIAVHKDTALVRKALEGGVIRLIEANGLTSSSQVTSKGEKALITQVQAYCQASGKYGYIPGRIKKLLNSGKLSF